MTAHSPPCRQAIFIHISETVDCPMSSVKINGERVCWEFCHFPTPNDPHSHWPWGKSRNSFPLRHYVIPESTTFRGPGTTQPRSSRILVPDGCLIGNCTVSHAPLAPSNLALHSKKAIICSLWFLPPLLALSLLNPNQSPRFFGTNLYFEMALRVSVNFISLITSCVRLQEKEPQTAYPMSFTWACHIAAGVLTGC